MTQRQPDSKALNKKHSQPPVKKSTHAYYKSTKINNTDSALKSRQPLKTDTKLFHKFDHF